MLPVLRLAEIGEQRLAERTADDLAHVEREEMLPSGRLRLLHNCVH